VKNALYSQIQLLPKQNNLGRMDRVHAVEGRGWAVRYFTTKRVQNFFMQNYVSVSKHI